MLISNGKEASEISELIVSAQKKIISKFIETITYLLRPSTRVVRNLVS